MMNGVKKMAEDLRQTKLKSDKELKDVKDVTFPFMTIIMLAFVIGILILSGLIVLQGAYKGETKEISTLDVTGTAKIYSPADKVDIYLSVETMNESAIYSQEENAIKMKNVRDAVLKFIDEKDIETVDYSLYPVFTYDKEGNEKLIGYRTLHQIKIKLILNIDNATEEEKKEAGEANEENKVIGKIIDGAVAAGANRVDNIVFGLSDKRYEELKNNVSSLAVANAKEKAGVIANEIGVKLVGVHRVSEGYVSVTPLTKSLSSLSESLGGTGTEISPGQIEVSASVGVTFKIA